MSQLPRRTASRSLSTVREEKTWAAEMEWLWTLPETATVQGDVPPSEQAVLVHTHPDPGVRWSGNDHVPTAAFEDVADHIEAGILLLGHLHTQYAVIIDRHSGVSLVANPGTVGQPRDGRLAIIVGSERQCAEWTF
jgi:hypothetical protein